MPFQKDDTEYLRQLAHIYPSDEIKEIKEMAAAVLREQLSKGERQNIRELLYDIIEKINDAQNKTPADESLAKAQKYQAAEIEELAEKVDSLLTEGQAEQLAGFGPKAAAFLAEALTGASDTAAATAYKALLTLDDGGTIDALCQLWAETRREDLAKIIVKKGYLAAKPLDLRVLTVLKTGAAPYMLNLNQETLSAILAAADDADPEIAARSLKMLAALTKKETVDLFCQMILDNPNDQRLLALAGQYQPSDLARAALFFCLSGQWQKYFSLEEKPARPLLSAGYLKASRQEKEAFVAAAVQAGYSRLAVEILLNREARPDLENISDAVWDKIIENIAAQKDFAFLKSLILKTPPEISRRIILLLRQNNAAELPEIPQLAAVCPDAGETLFMPDGRELFTLSLADAKVKIECLAFHPQEPLLAAGCSDGAIRLWRFGGAEPWRTVMAAETGICALAFAADGSLLVTASKDGKANIWNLPGVTWASAVRGQTGQVISLSVSNAGQILAAAHNTAAAPLIRFWYWDGNFMTNKAILPPSILALPVLHPKLQVAFGVNRQGQLRAWPLKPKEAGGFVPQPEAEVAALSVATCGGLLATLNAGGLLNIRQAETGALLASLPLRRTGSVFALSSRGDLAAVADAATHAITVYRTRFKKPLANATSGDLAHAAEMAQAGLAGNAYEYLRILLAAKLQEGGE